MTGSTVRQGPAVALAVVVVGVEVVLVAGWVTLLVRDDGWSRWVWLLLGLLLLWQLVPRPPRVAGRAERIGPGDAPHLHRLLGDLAGSLGSRLPSRVAVDTTYATATVHEGYLGRTTLVVGLPQWTALDDGERIAVLAHELVCADAQRGPAGVVVRLADDLLTSARTVLAPARVVRADEAAINQANDQLGNFGGAGALVANRLGREASAAVGAAGLSVVSAPVRAVQDLLRRLWRPVALAGARRGDEAAEGLAGTGPTRSALLAGVGVPRGLSAAHAAARTGGDPFTAIAGAGRPDAHELERRVAATPEAAVDPWHPPTARRLAALGAGSAGALLRPDHATVRAADAELEVVRHRLARRFAEELVHGRP